jgi:membrane protease subunit HflK
MIDAAERGVVLRFGAYQGLTQPGLRWHLPWPIESVEKINIGATERLSYRGSMLTRDENIVDVDLVVQFRRTDPQGFLFQMRDPEQTLTDATASAIREVVGRNVLDFVLTEGRAEVSREAQDLLQATLDAYGAGITVYEVNLQDASFPGDVQVSVQDSIKAREDRERRILEAQSYSNEILPRARGEAARRRQTPRPTAPKLSRMRGVDRFSHSRQYRRPRLSRASIYIRRSRDLATPPLTDTESSNNLLYLPLDQLMQRRSLPNGEISQGVTSVPMTNNIAPRSRERETR